MFAVPYRYVYETVALFLAFAAGFAALYAYHTDKKEDVLAALGARIEEKRVALVRLADVTGRNDGTEIINAVVRDCDARSEYEALLGRLDTLSSSNLRTLEALSDACADFFALKKRVVVSHMEEHAKDLAGLIAIRDTFQGEEVYEPIRKAWEDILALERTRRDLLSEQVTLQDDIIELILAGKRAELPEKLSRAQAINEALSVKHVEMLTLRTEENRIWTMVVGRR